MSANGILVNKTCACGHFLKTLDEGFLTRFLSYKEGMFEFPNIDPVAFSIGPIALRWYSLAYLTGFLLGWRYCLVLADRSGGVRPSRDDIDDFLPWAIGGVILGGRLGYVLFYQFEYYMANFGDILKLWHGGMSFHGGALGVIVALFVFSAMRRISVLRLADYVAACVPIGLFFGRIANFINGELFGRVTDASVGMVFPRGGPLPRHPSQLYEALLEGAVLFVLLFVLVRSKFAQKNPGVVAGGFLAGYGVMRGCVEFYREPDAHLGLVGGMISMGQMLSVPMILAGLTVFGYAVLRQKS